jgi:hypothetical protein
VVRHKGSIELRVRYGRSVVLQADSQSLYYIAIYGGYLQSDDGWVTVAGSSPADPNYHVEIRAKREIPKYKYRAALRKLWRIISGKKPKTSKV